MMRAVGRYTRATMFPSQFTWSSVILKSDATVDVIWAGQLRNVCSLTVIGYRPEPWPWHSCNNVQKHLDHARISALQNTATRITYQRNQSRKPPLVQLINNLTLKICDPRAFESMIGCQTPYGIFLNFLCVCLDICLFRLSDILLHPATFRALCQVKELVNPQLFK